MAMLVELLAAVPSVGCGLWGFFFLIPKLQGFEKWVASTFSFVPFIGGGTVQGPNYFIAGLILAIMILPIVSAISREVMATVPPDQKEAALALGATRWEMIRMAVLPYSRAGIAGASMLGLGPAIRETIAVPLVLIIYYLLKNGLGAISWNFLSTDPNGNFLGNPGGIKSAILGTIEIVAIGAAIAIPVGMGIAIYLTEYGRSGPFAQTVRFFVDVLTGVPSIVFGLFIYTVLLLAGP